MSTRRDSPRLTTGHLVILLVSTSAPLVVLSSGISSSMRASGVLGLAVLFPVLAVLLLGFAGAYGALSRNVAHAGGFYPYLSQVFGPSVGLGAAAVAVLGYNAMAVGLQGMLGSIFVETLQSETGVALPWWLPAVVALLVIGGVGTLSLRWSVWASGVLLALELAAVLVFDFSALGSPGPQGVSLAAFNPAGLLSGAVALAASFAFAAWVGVETGSTYSEELHRPRRTIVKATMISVAILGLLYTVSSWALTVAAGPNQVITQAKQLGTAQFPTLVADRLGASFADVFNAVLVGGLFAAALCFHNVSARQLGALARDGVLPASFGRRTRSGGAPFVASLVQTVLGIVVIAVFAVADTDPVTESPVGGTSSVAAPAELFAWLTNVGATCVLLLLAAISLATIVFLLRSDFEEASFLGWEGPVVAAFFSFAAFGTLFVLSITQFSRLVGVPAGAPQAWFLPALVPALFVGGILVGRLFRLTRAEAMAGFGFASSKANTPATDALSPATAEKVEEPVNAFADHFEAPVPAWATNAGTPEWPPSESQPPWSPGERPVEPEWQWGAIYEEPAAPVPPAGPVPGTRATAADWFTGRTRPPRQG